MTPIPTTAVAETVRFKLNAGVTDAAFITLSQASESYVRSAQGFIERRLSKGADGVWTDYVLWATMENAKTLAADFANQPFAGPLMAAIDGTTAEMRHDHVLWHMD